MGKLGKKARKFARKNLQSVLKRKRKLKSLFKKKAAKRDERGQVEDPEGDKIELSCRRTHTIEDIENISLDAIFGEDEGDFGGDDSGSDGYLSEDNTSFTPMGETESENHVEENNGDASLSVQNKEIHLELASNMKKLNRLKDKDPQFSKVLESNSEWLNAFRNEEDYPDEGETSDDDSHFAKENGTKLEVPKLNGSAFDCLCQLVMEQHNVPAFIRILNGYRAACHYGTESSSVLEDAGRFSKILMFVLHEADNIFRNLLGISSNGRKEAILELKMTSKWKTLKPLVKSYLRSTLFLLNEVTDSQLLAFVLTRLRASIIFFAAFRPLLQRLIKISVHLWATDEGTLSLKSFLIIQDVASVFNSDCFDTCLTKACKAFVGHCKFVEPVLFKHLQFLKNSLVELFSQDLHKSFSKGMALTQQLAKILRLGLQSKKKEAIRKICSWQYASCIDLWVSFISANIHDYDLQPLLYMIIQIIIGIAILFPGPRYLPLRVKCIQWLNHLSSSSGVFIPVAYLVLDLLEYKIGKEGGQPGRDFSFSTSIKLPKYWLKSQTFQEECIFSAIELLAMHFMQWSYHISFPELATVPLVCLRRFHETTTIESFRRVVKRFIDQVEQNVEYVRKKRDEVAFSPKDHQSVESFLQLEKYGGNAPFMHYYKSTIEKAASRSMLMNGKISFVEKKRSKGKR